ncbi:hypothetical protein BVRB_6g140580 [Beta vulgaris subsp. vulgaris]|nr:hypothetical protein BVRB_6g140580 [Beta vulgaris subsp. vulgaris]
MKLLKIRELLLLSLVFFFFLCNSSLSLLTPDGVNYEVQALMDIKESLRDPHGVLDNWDRNAVDPCSWAMVSCSSEDRVISLGIPSQGLYGTLSPSIGNLTNLQTVLLQNNNISGHIPAEIGRLSKLQTLDISDNFFRGRIPPSLSHLSTLHYLRLNNNSLSGEIPQSFANMTQLTFLDLSYNNLSGPVPRFLTKTFSVVGNPQICAATSDNDCYGTAQLPLSFNVNNTASFQPSQKRKGHGKLALALGSSLASICLLILGFGFLLWWRYKHHKQMFFDVKDRHHEDVCLGNLRRFHFRELHSATNHFSSKNIVGKGGFGIVYRGHLSDGTVVAVKRLKDGNAIGGEIQFQTEVEMISLAVHRNLLRLNGFCMTATERLLVYPYMSNGSLLDHRDSHVTTAVRGTVGHIAPEYLSTGQSSEKTDVFGFGILLLELITGQRAIDFGKAANQKGAMLDWVKKINQEKKLEMLVDKDLKNNYDSIELEEIVQVALLCTQFLPNQRPRMSEVVRMLEGDGLAEKWEASQRADSTRSRVTEFSSSERYSDLTDDSSLLVQAMELSGPR